MTNKSEIELIERTESANFSIQVFIAEIRIALLGLDIFHIQFDSIVKYFK